MTGREMQMFLGRERVTEFRVALGVQFERHRAIPVRVTGAAPLRVVVANTDGRRWEAAERIRFDG